MSTKTKSALLATTCALLLTGCANLDEMMQAELDTYEFDCDGDRDIRVAFLDGRDEVRLFSGGESVDLRLVDTRDGGGVRVYEDERRQVRMVDRGDQIDVSVEGKDNFEDCEPEDRGYRGGGGAF